MERTLFQRPQQLMQQFAARGHDVVYLGCVGWKKALDAWRSGHASGQIANMRFATLAYSPFGGHLRGLSAPAVKRAAGRKRASSVRGAGSNPAHPRVLWLYHPDFVRFAEVLQPDLVVYDVMDRFPAFSMSGRDVRLRERDAYARADVIFAGGRSLCAAVEEDLSAYGIRKQVHCFSSGVDLEHFARALDPRCEVPADVAPLPRPVLGYFGAVDERLDYDLLAAAAALRPAWSFVLVGPFLVEAPPMPPNVHFTGGRPYADLPRYLKSFDVCLLPFRQSDLVAHVSPTKTPEYLAGGRPVISTPIPDVVRDYDDAVGIVTSAAGLVAQVERLLAEARPASFWQGIARERSHTWAQIAEEMLTIVCAHDALRRHARGG
jgi:UDP-galactopyranose mutase